MEHLDLETMARLVDEACSPEERAHLDACDRCRDELDALRRQTSHLRSLPDLSPPASEWDALEARLREDGLIRPGAVGPWWVRGEMWLRAAAGVALFLAGTALGRSLDGGVRIGAFTEQAGEPGTVTSVADITSAEEAEELVRLRQQGYFDALLRYRELAAANAVDPTAGGDPTRRYAALEALVAASQAAVRHAPTDPFLNGVLVNAFAEREHMLRQIASTWGDNWF